MAKYAYVKSGFGTSITDTTFQVLQAEAFGGVNLTAANCYANVVDAITYGGLTAGDFIVSSDLDNESFVGATTIVYPDGCSHICVSDTDGSVLSSGAKISTDVGSNLLLDNTNQDGGKIYFYGITFIPGNDLYPTALGIKATYDKCTFYTGPAAYDNIRFAYNGIYAVLNDCTVVLQDPDAYVSLAGAAKVTCNKLNIVQDPLQNYVFRNNAGGGFHLNIENTDMSQLTLAQGFIRSNLDNGDVTDVKIIRCKTGTYDIMYLGDRPMLFVDIHASDTGSGYHYFKSQRKEGDFLESLTAYRNGGSLYDINNASSNYSCEVQTNANVIEFSNPLEVKLPAKKVDLTAGPVTLTVHIIQRNGTVVPTNLNDKNCILRAVAPDSTDTALGVEYKSSTKDILSTATDLPASTETWTTPADGANEVKQQVSVTIPQNTQPGMTSAIVQLYLDVSKDLVNEDSGAGEIFIDFAPVVS